MSRGACFVLGLGLGALVLPACCEMAAAIAQRAGSATYAFGVK
jgi:hypothetical protein